MLLSLIRTLLLYILITAAVRIMGKRQISELQTSELVVTLLISDLAAIPMQDTGQPLASGVIPIAVLMLCELLASFLMLRHARFRQLVCGRPVIVICRGKLDQKAMRSLRMTTEDLWEQLRQAGVFRLEDVSYAIVETNGKLSVLKKPDQEPPTLSQLGLPVQDHGLETVVLSDGAVSELSLRLCGRDARWVEKILKQEGLRPGEVFLMTADAAGNYQIIRKEERK